MYTIISVLLVASVLTVFSTPPYKKSSLSPDFLTEGIQHRLPSYRPSTLTAKQEIPVRSGQHVPWLCFTKQIDKMCSCTILSPSFVLVRSYCLSVEAQAGIEVYAGATTESNADQIVRASVLNTTEPPPKGVVALKLENELKFNNAVTSIKLVCKNHDNHFGLVSGFRNSNGTYQLEHYSAGVFEDTCLKGLCVVGHQWPELDSNESKATDFLDYYDELDEHYYFIGVLDTHYTQSFATYYKVKDMIPWVQKYLNGEVVGNCTFNGFKGDSREPKELRL